MPRSVAWLQRFLADYPGTVVTVTHDRYFLDEVAGWILELDRGHGIPYEGNYSGWLEQKQKRLEQEGKQEAARQRTLERELEWVRESPRARQAKSKARITAYESAGLRKAARRRPRTAQIVLPPGPRLGDLVIEAKHVAKAYGDQLLIEDLSFRLPPGGIVGVIGAERRRQDHALPHDHRPGNARPRQLPPRRDGEARLCRPVARHARRATRPCGEEISGGNDEIDLGAAQDAEPRLLLALQFPRLRSAEEGRASSRAASATASISPRCSRPRANVILLDEPTNDLDVDTLRALEEALFEFPGCAVVITHDRWFLDRIATHILAFEGDEPGRYGSRATTPITRPTASAASAPRPSSPHRIRYKPLTRA